MPEDEYKTPERLLSDQPGFVPILPFPGKPGDPLWAWQRADGGRDESEFDPLFLFWYDIQGGKFQRHVISFNHLQYDPGHENVNEPPQFAPGTGMRITVGDLNADGKSDLVLAGRGGLYAFINRGLTPIPKGLNPKIPLSGERQP